MERVYLRCSTDEQMFMQQQECVNSYLKRTGVDINSVETIVEKVSGTVLHTERKLHELLHDCASGDVIYISELSRLGRNMTDLFNIVNYATEHDITIIQCKDGMIIENKSIMGKTLLFALAIAAEIEVNNIQQRTQMGMDARKHLLKTQGFFISKKGEICTHLGNKKGCDMSVAANASARASQDRKMEWFDNSVGFQWVKRKLMAGTPRREIIKEFNEMKSLGIEGFSTRNGSPLSEGVLSVWAKQVFK